MRRRSASICTSNCRRARSTTIDAAHKAEQRRVPDALDGGELGPERKLYCRELIARFGHALALNWNLGEENTQSAARERAMAEIPSRHRSLSASHRRAHLPHAAGQGLLSAARRPVGTTGASLQNAWNAAHQRTLNWVASRRKPAGPGSSPTTSKGPPASACRRPGIPRH